VGHTSFRITLKRQHNLRRTVPSGGHVLGHIPRILFRIITIPPGEPKITNLEFAICVDEKISGFEVTVQDVCGVDVFEAAEDLVDEGLVVGVSEGLTGADDSVQVCLKELDVKVD